MSSTNDVVCVLGAKQIKTTNTSMVEKPFFVEIIVEESKIKTKSKEKIESESK